MEYPLRTHLKICTDADYLQAHLTFLERRSSDRNPLALLNVKHQLTTTLKKLLEASTDYLHRHHRPN